MDRAATTRWGAPAIACLATLVIQSHAFAAPADPDKEPCNLPGGASPTGDCRDGDPCTDDVCVDGYCQHNPNTGRSCNDNDPCTVEDTCWLGMCQSTPRDCNDNEYCTYDHCVSGDCLHDPIHEGLICDQSGDPCVEERCEDGSCVWRYVAGASCDDNNPCTIDDTCEIGACTGTPIDCDDGLACTYDSCQDGICEHNPVNNGGTCEDDGDPCTPDKCVDGECVHTWEEYCDWVWRPVEWSCATYGCYFDVALPS